MDLNELKALEAKIAGLEAEKQELLDKQKMVVVLHKFFNGKIGRGNTSSVQITGVRTISTLKDMSYRNRYTGYENMFDYRRESFVDTMSLDTALNMDYVTIDLTEDTSRTSKEYTNLDDVKKDLTQTIGKDFEEQILKLKESNLELQYDLDNSKSDSDREITALKKGHAVKIEELNETKDLVISTMDKAHKATVESLENEINKLRGEYEDLKSDKKRVSLEQQVSDLVGELAKLQARGFWARLFNTK